MTTVTTNTITARAPKSTGMELIKFERIPLKNIQIRPSKNTSRLTGISQKTVDEFIHLMQNGLYEPEYNIPPVVTEGPDNTYYLESGEHRYNAHLYMESEGWTEFSTFYAAVVKFVPMNNMSAEYWREVWITKENTEVDSFVRNRANTKDIANSVALLVDQKIITKDDMAISTAIENMGVNPNTGMFNTIKSLVWKELGSVTKVVQGISSKTKEKFVKEYTDVHNLSREPISATFKELDDADFDWRLLKKLYKLYIKNPKTFKKLLVIAHTNGADPQKVKKIRERKTTLLARFEKDMRDFVKALDTVNEPFEVQIKWVPQLHGEGTLEDYTLVSIQ